MGQRAEKGWIAKLSDFGLSVKKSNVVKTVKFLVRFISSFFCHPSHYLVISSSSSHLILSSSSYFLSYLILSHSHSHSHSHFISSHHHLSERCGEAAGLPCDERGFALGRAAHLSSRQARALRHAAASRPGTRQQGFGNTLCDRFELLIRRMCFARDDCVVLCCVADLNC
jgi:hypothetical protein